MTVLHLDFGRRFINWFALLVVAPVFHMSRLFAEAKLMIVRTGFDG
jgi:hypothetical protein